MIVNGLRSDVVTLLWGSSFSSLHMDVCSQPMSLTLRNFFEFTKEVAKVVLSQTVPSIIIKYLESRYWQFAVRVHVAWLSSHFISSSP